jgi:hypothetical protein
MTDKLTVFSFDDMNISEETAFWQMSWEDYGTSLICTVHVVTALGLVGAWKQLLVHDFDRIVSTVIMEDIITVLKM